MYHETDVSEIAGPSAADASPATTQAEQVAGQAIDQKESEALKKQAFTSITFVDCTFDGGILEVSALAESRKEFFQDTTAAQLSDTSGSEKGATGLLRLWETYDKSFHAAVAAAKHEATQLDPGKAKNLVFAIVKSGYAVLSERERLLKAVGLMCLKEDSRKKTPSSQHMEAPPLFVTLHQLEDCLNRIEIQDSLAVLGGDQCLKMTFQTASAEQDQRMLQSVAQEINGIISTEISSAASSLDEAISTVSSMVPTIPVLKEVMGLALWIAQAQLRYALCCMNAPAAI